jgi:diadenosine tetraphosphate (Ap4A) HIT family hydrolase
MRPDATSPFPSPFSAIPEAEWLCANELAFAIYDRFPVSPGHVLVITRRVVPTYFDCTAAEQAAVRRGPGWPGSAVAEDMAGSLPNRGDNLGPGGVDR